MWLIERTLLSALLQGTMTVTGGEPPTHLLSIWNVASISVHKLLQNWCHIASLSQPIEDLGLQSPSVFAVFIRTLENHHLEILNVSV